MGCRPRRRGVPLRRPVSSTPSSVRRSSALNAERVHFCALTRPARFWFPYAGMPDLVVRPAKSDLRLKMALPGGLGPPACGLGNRRSVLVSYGSNAPEDAGARLNATRFRCGTIREMSDGFVRRQRRPATATCGPCHLSPPGRRTARGEFRPPLVVFPYPLPLCCLSGSHLERPFGPWSGQSPLGGVKSATGFDRSLKSEVPSPFARALPERPVFEARGYRYCGT